MKRTLKYVSLDVHQATTVIAVLDETGRVIARQVVPTEALAILDVFRGMRGEVHVALEEGTQAQWLHDLLAPVVAEVIVCDRRGQGSHGSKADLSDAEQLVELLRQGALRAVYHRNTERAALKELARTYQNLIEDATRVMLRLKALFRARGIKTPGRSVYDLQQRNEWLRQLPDAGARFRAQALYTEFEVLQRLRPQAKAAPLREAQRDRAWTVLRAVPPRARACSAAPRHDADALAVSHQAQSVGVRRPGRGYPGHRRV